jgi:hypothetical protein
LAPWAAAAAVQDSSIFGFWILDFGLTDLGYLVKVTASQLIKCKWLSRMQRNPKSKI